MVRPVIFPAGRERLATSPAAIGSALSGITIGITLVNRRAARAASVPLHNDDIDLELN